MSIADIMNMKPRELLSTYKDVVTQVPANEEAAETRQVMEQQLEIEIIDRLSKVKR